MKRTVLKIQIKKLPREKKLCFFLKEYFKKGVKGRKIQKNIGEGKRNEQRGERKNIKLITKFDIFFVVALHPFGEGIKIATGTIVDGTTYVETITF